MNESYFTGIVEFDKKEFKVNIQDGGKEMIRMPFGLVDKKSLTLRFSGKDVFPVEENLEYCGKSEWIEIYSSSLNRHLADNQDKFDFLEIFTE